MSTHILTIAIERESDAVVVRQRTREIVTGLGFDTQDQTRIATAVSEIVRNAWEHGGGGHIEYWLADDNPQRLDLVIRDNGRGIADIDTVLSGSYRSPTGMGLGVIGARRLMDRFDIETGSGRGTIVRMSKSLGRRAARIGPAELTPIAEHLALRQKLDPLAEIRRQNRDMLLQLEELNRRQQELTRLNQELHDTNRGVVALYAELDERADHLRRADELKSRFLSNMSHEFRTPLNSILALSRLLMSRSSGGLTADQEQQLHYIIKAAENLTALVNDLLDLAKVEAGKTVLTPAEFTAASLFGALRGMLRPLLVGDVVALVFEDATEVPPLFTDEGKVSQVLRNLLSNAIKFTPAGEVRASASFDPSTDTVTFAVRDTGIGIAEDQIDIIWQEFGQVAHALQPKVQGTGLGLPLSKKLAELLGGTITLDSKPGEGSLFTLKIPRVLPQAVDAAEDETQWRLDPGYIPVLAVEDDPADRFAFERALDGTRYQAIPARSIAEAKRVLDRIAPAAVLLDIVLGGEEGWRLLIEMKQRRATEHIPVIVVSTTQEERKARSLGADEYLSKPIDRQQIINALDAATGGRSVTKVLVVDDEEVSRYLVRQLLPLGTFAFSEASDGAEGLRRIRDEGPDVVLLDLKMPGMDGFEFLARLAAEDDREPPPTIVITASRLDAQQRQRLKKAAAVVPKSELSTDALVAAIRQATRTEPDRPP